MSKGKTMPLKADKRAMAPMVLRSRVTAKQLLSIGTLNKYATFFALSKVPFESGEKTTRGEEMAASACGDLDSQQSQLSILEEQMAAGSRYFFQQYLKCKKTNANSRLYFDALSRSKY